MPKSAIKRSIPLTEVVSHNHYVGLDELAVIFNHDIVEMEDGTFRWKPNTITDLLFHEGLPMYEGEWNGSNKRILGRLDLNKFWIDVSNKKISMEEAMKLYMESGYSLCGFIEVFGQKSAYEWNLPDAIIPENEEDEDYPQDIIDYMIAKYNGQVLKI